MPAKLTYNKDGKAMVFLSGNEKPWWWGIDTSSRGIGDEGYMRMDRASATEALSIISNGEDFSYKSVIPEYNGSPVNDYRFIVNSMSGRVISVVSDKYFLQQPAEFAAIVDEVFCGTLVVDTFGTLNRGRSLFASCLVSEDSFNDKKDGVIQRRITAIGSCDRTVALTFLQASLRTVCWNTFTPLLRSPNKWKATHNSNFEVNVDSIKRSIGLNKSYFTDLLYLYRSLSTISMDKQNIVKFSLELTDHLGDSKAAKASRDIYTLAAREASSNGWNRAAALNAVTEFVSHPERAVHTYGSEIKTSRLSQEVGLRIGTNSPLANKAVKLLTSDLPAVRKLIAA